MRPRRGGRPGCGWSGRCAGLGRPVRRRPGNPTCPGGKGATVRTLFRRPSFRLVLAAAAGLAAIALTATFVFVNQGLRDRLAKAEADLAGARERLGTLEPSARRGPAEASPAGGQPAPDAVAVLALEPGVLRGGAGAQRLALGAGTRVVWLQLLVAAPDAYPEYRVVVRTPEGKELARFDRLASRASAEGPVVDVALPAALLPRGATCLIRLEGVDGRGGVEELGTYVVEISR